MIAQAMATHGSAPVAHNRSVTLGELRVREAVQKPRDVRRLWARLRRRCKECVRIDVICEDDPLYGCEARVRAVAETDGPSRCGEALNSSEQSTPQSPVSSRTIPHTTNRVGGPAARARWTADGWTPRDARRRRRATGRGGRPARRVCRCASCWATGRSPPGPVGVPLVSPAGK